MEVQVATAASPVTFWPNVKKVRMEENAAYPLSAQMNQDYQQGISTQQAPPSSTTSQQVRKSSSEHVATLRMDVDRLENEVCTLRTSQSQMQGTIAELQRELRELREWMGSSRVTAPQERPVADLDQFPNGTDMEYRDGFESPQALGQRIMVHPDALWSVHDFWEGF
ncbi:hypothetical protein BC829DRAFT_100422 [Chytridium lagenaria]|nr:hypothetical protein BC829DRAFT_100422 [Chytridium lagenaria]